MNIGTRRIPSQERGQQRRNVILDAAERLVATHGLGDVTTNQIALEAGVPIGSVYQFFANKEAVVHGLVERYKQSVIATMLDLPANLPDLTPTEIVNVLFARVIAIAQRRSAFLSTVLSAGEGGMLWHIATPIREAWQSGIQNLIAQRAPWLSPEQCALHAVVSFTASRSLFARALYEQKMGKTALAQHILEQARLMQVAYYEFLLKN
jgi:AcrR family transcriptional regulator